MGDRTGIEWTRSDDGVPGATWNPITGCSRVSPGCDNCYAERQAGTRLKNVPAYAGTTTPEGRWTGRLNVLDDRFDQPLRWKRPRRIFVNSMSDLFHPDVSDDVLLRVFEVMARASWHTFQVLTKRPQRMADFSRRLSWRGPDNNEPYLDEPDTPVEDPLLNVWLGVSIESQSYAFRARYLRETNAAVRWVSAEPLLGPLDLTRWLDPLDGVGWVVAGGESGPAARPMHPRWARDLRDQCVAAGVPYLFKQWGEYAPATHGDGVGYLEWEDGTFMTRPGKHAAGRELDGRTWDEYPTDPRSLLINIL